jgi:hypothetical protein
MGACVGPLFAAKAREERVRCTQFQSGGNALAMADGADDGAAILLHPCIHGCGDLPTAGWACAAAECSIMIRVAAMHGGKLRGVGNASRTCQSATRVQVLNVSAKSCYQQYVPAQTMKGSPA